MAAVAGSVAIATYMSSSMAEAEYNYVPSLNEGTVVISAFDDKTAARLPQARAAVERNMAVTGGHADFRHVWAGSDCNVYGDAENACGSVELVKPAGKAASCPLTGKGAKELAARLTADEHKKLMRSPACLVGIMTSGVFNAGEHGIVVADEAMLSTYVKLDDPAAAKALAAGTPVLLNPVFAKNGEVTIKAVHHYSDKDKQGRKLHPGKARTTTDRLKVYVAPEKYAATPGISMILPQRTAERLGLHTRASGSVYAVTHAPTDTEQQRTYGAIEQAGGGIWTQSESGPGRTDNSMLLILTLFAGIVTLGAAAITTGLAKADAEADLNTLSAVGAPRACDGNCPASSAWWWRSRVWCSARWPDWCLRWHCGWSICARRCRQCGWSPRSPRTHRSCCPGPPSACSSWACRCWPVCSPRHSPAPASHWHGGPGDAGGHRGGAAGGLTG